MPRCDVPLVEAESGGEAAASCMSCRKRCGGTQHPCMSCRRWWRLKADAMYCFISRTQAPCNDVLLSGIVVLCAEVWKKHGNLWHLRKSMMYCYCIVGIIVYLCIAFIASNFFEKSNAPSHTSEYVQGAFVLSAMVEAESGCHVLFHQSARKQNGSQRSECQEWRGWQHPCMSCCRWWRLKTPTVQCLYSIIRCSKNVVTMW